MMFANISKNLMLCLFVFGLLTACSDSPTNGDASSDDQDEDLFGITKVIPTGGNTYLVEGNHGNVEDIGIVEWTDIESIFHAYVASEATVPAQIGVRTQSGYTQEPSTILVSVNDEDEELEVPGGSGGRELIAGEFEMEGSAYNEIKLEGVEKEGDEFARISDIVIKIKDQTEIYYVPEDNMYFGRRGPSVHMSYNADLPQGSEIEWFYNEVTVPEGKDPHGSFYMTNGFAEGYFGMQVNSPTERRVLFSVWSPYETHDPDEVPEEYYVELLESGDDVVTGEFGGEGSGGQSYLVYDWEAGNTYRFLNRVRPDGEGNTEYEAYFYAPEVGDWKLIARWSRPKTDTWYERPHSFLEGFNPEQGHINRYVEFHNQWVKTTEGNWYEATDGTFTADATADGEHRMDRTGGVAEGNKDSFYLEMGGFFFDDLPFHTEFTRNASGEDPPSHLDLPDDLR